MTYEQQIEIWLQEGKLKKQKPHADQIQVLLSRAKRHIDVARKNISIDLETAYTLAYNSMLKAGRALVLAKGYRTDDGGQHKTTVDFCKFFVPATSADLTTIFDRMRRNRNILQYDPHEASEIDEEEAKDAIESARGFLNEIEHICS